MTLTASTDAAISPDVASRILILAPLGRDAPLAAELLAADGMLCHVCADVGEMLDQLAVGAAALLLTQEALLPQSSTLAHGLAEQPAWSDVPIVVLVSGGADARLAPQVARFLESDVNASLLERPVRVTTLTSAMRAALRARRRQYELRDQLQAMSLVEFQEQRALERTRHLQSVTVQLGRSREAESLFELIVDALAELLDVTILGLYLLEEPEADFVSTAARGLEQVPGGTHLPRHASLAGRALDQRRTLAVDDASEDEGVVLPRLVGGGAPVGAVAVAPIFVDDEPIGAIEVYSAQPRHWQADDLELMTAFAAAAAVAISNVRHHEKEQQEAQARDDFLAAASHDLKNPLTAIRGSVQMLERTLKRSGSVPPERLASSIRTINGAAVRMTALIDELLDIARLRMGEPLVLEYAPTDLVALAREQVSMHQAAGEHHRVRLETDLQSLVGAWDARRLQRVLENLLSNAIKYSPAGGEITVYVGRAQDLAVLAVRDQGIGIPAADLPHVFERFRRAANVLGRIEGTGIGLAAAVQIVYQHGGTVDLDSREGQGTTVTVRLPLGGEAIDG